MKTVYIAGPFTAPTPWLIENNVRRAEELSLKVCALGNVVALCPHTMYRFFYGMETANYWYEATLELLRRCDAIIMLNGWEQSTGAVGEHTEAIELSIPIFTEDQLDLVQDWAKLVLPSQQEVHNWLQLEKAKRKGHHE